MFCPDEFENQQEPICIQDRPIWVLLCTELTSIWIKSLYKQYWMRADVYLICEFAVDVASE